MTTQSPAPGTTAPASPLQPPARPGDPVPGGRWAEAPAHLAWLDDQLRKLVRFSLRTVRPEGGFHYPAADGTPQPGRDVELFLTARMTHMASIAHLRGIPGAGRLVDHGVRSLRSVFVDAGHGGFISALGDPDGRKMTYDQVHVGLAASSARAAGHPDATALLDQVAEIVDTHLWEADEGMLRESFAADWGDVEDYRGANATMHSVEAFLAMGDVTGDRVWHDRAYGMADRIINVGARAQGWLVPEHFDGRWQLDLGYNADEPNHPFRPYGATYGHLLEWARFLVNLDASPAVGGRPWLLEGAQALTESALGGWGADGQEGLVYTVDWDRRPRLPAAAALARLRGHPGLRRHRHRHRRHALGGLVPSPVGPRVAVHRRPRHLVQRARHRPPAVRHRVARTPRRLPLCRRLHRPERPDDTVHDARPHGHRVALGNARHRMTASTAVDWARHGQNVANLARTMSHRAFDVDLTDRGVQEAQALAERLHAEGRRYAVLACCPLRRARHTAEIVGERLGLTACAVMEGLREVNVGVLDGCSDEATWGTTSGCWTHGTAATCRPGSRRGRTVASSPPGCAER